MRINITNEDLHAAKILVEYYGDKYLLGVGVGALGLDYILKRQYIRAALTCAVGVLCCYGDLSKLGAEEVADSLNNAKESHEDLKLIDIEE